MEKEMITITDENNETMEVELISVLPSKRDDNVYLLYTKNEPVDAENSILYIVKLIEENDEMFVKNIEGEELQYVQSLISSALKGE